MPASEPELAKQFFGNTHASGPKGPTGLLRNLPQPIASTPAWVIPSAIAFYDAQLRPTARRLRDRRGVIVASVDHAWKMKRRHSDCLFLEFGVFEGGDLQAIADTVARKTPRGAQPTIVHGFDSFEGLPETWQNNASMPLPKGHFHLHGRAPKFLRPDCCNVSLHPGWFADTVAPFLDGDAEPAGHRASAAAAPVAFIHADADLYSSTVCFLRALCERRRVTVGSVVLFDEYWNYEGWQDGEYRAWLEISAEFGLEFAYLLYHGPQSDSEPDTRHRTNAYGFKSVAVVVTRVPSVSAVQVGDLCSESRRSTSADRPVATASDTKPH
jgi:hypothetical protein